MEQKTKFHPNSSPHCRRSTVALSPPPTLPSRSRASGLGHAKISRSNSASITRSATITCDIDAKISGLCMNPHNVQQNENQRNNHKHHSARFNNYNKKSITNNSKEARSLPNSPSAWALSPGRSLQQWLLSPQAMTAASKQSTKAEARTAGKGGILKYFVRQKKATSIQRDQYLRYCILYSGILQWRYANARQEAAMATAKFLAEKRMFNAWIRIFKKRNSIVSKQIELQRLKHRIKLHQIIGPEVHLLKKWAKLESTYLEALEELATTLSAISNRLPLVHGAKVELNSIQETMKMATGFAESIKATLSIFLNKAGEMQYLVTELLDTMKEEGKCFEKMGEITSIRKASLAREQSLRTHLIQANEDL